MGDKAKNVARWIFDGAISIMIPALIGLCAVLWNLNSSAIELKTTVRGMQVAQEKILMKQDAFSEFKTATSANRFTIQDGIRLTEKMTELANAIALIPDEIPPVWWKEQVLEREAKTEVCLGNLEVRIRALETGR